MSIPLVTDYCFIDGRWVAGEGPVFEKHCPAKGGIVWQAPSASRDQVEAAVAAARTAFTHWSRSDLLDRHKILERYADELRLRKEAIALAISRDMGKLLRESRSEAEAMIAKIAISIEAQTHRAGFRQSTSGAGQAELDHRPHGVMAVFGPYNFPGHLPNGHLVPALLAGNTCVFKASELAPSVAPLMMEAFAAAGLPTGCVNLLQGARETGAHLLASDINGLLFTGSEQTGRMFHRYFAGRPEIMLALEMGGNNPLIIWDPADVAAATDIAIESAFLTTGQRCSCARRLILPRGPFGDRVLEAICERVRSLTTGQWDDETAFMGPLVSAGAAEKAVEFQDKLLAGGGKAILALQHPDRSHGFVSAGLIEMSSAGMIDEELFGPLLQVYRARDIDEAVEIGNATRFGLAAGLVCDDAGHWRAVRSELRAGILNLNRPTTGASSSLPFGGPGASGNYRPGGYYAADYCAWPQASQVTWSTCS